MLDMKRVTILVGGHSQEQGIVTGVGFNWHDGNPQYTVTTSGMPYSGYRSGQLKLGE